LPGFALNALWACLPVLLTVARASTVDSAVIYVEEFRSQQPQLMPKARELTAKFTEQILLATLFKKVVEREDLDRVIEARKAEDRLAGKAPADSGHLELDALTFLKARMAVSGQLEDVGEYKVLCVKVVDLQTSAQPITETEPLPNRDSTGAGTEQAMRRLVLRAIQMTRQPEASEKADGGILLLKVKSGFLGREEEERLTTALAADAESLFHAPIVLPGKALEALPVEYRDVLSGDFDYGVFNESEKRKLLAAKSILRCSTMIEVKVDPPTFYELRGSIQEFDLNSATLRSAKTVSLKRSKYKYDDLIEQLVRVNRGFAIPVEPSYLVTVNFGLLWPYSFTNPEQRRRADQELPSDPTTSLRAPFYAEMQRDVFLEFVPNWHPMFNPEWVLGFIPYPTDTTIAETNDTANNATGTMWSARNQSILFGGTGVSGNLVDWPRFRLRMDVCGLLGYKWERERSKSEYVVVAREEDGGIFQGKYVLYRSTIERSLVGGWLLGAQALLSAEVRLYKRLSLSVSAGMISLFAYRLRGSSHEDIQEIRESPLTPKTARTSEEDHKISLVRADFGYGDINTLHDPDAPLLNAKGQLVGYRETFDENTFFPVRIGLTYEFSN
jgi:hypothetical protein